MPDTITEDPLLASVDAALSGVLGVRTYLHPARPGAVAVRGVLWESCAGLLEDAGFEVERGAGWLTVR
jgi:hypothetical protein